MHVRTPVPPMQGVPDRVAHVVLRALAKDPAQRQQNAEQLHAECQQVVAEMMVQGQGMHGHGMSGSVPVQQPPPQMMQQRPDPARTMIAGSMQAPQIMGGPPPPMGGPPPPVGMHGRPGMPMPPQQMPSHTPTTPQGHGQPQTVLLPDSQGVVSMARQSQQHAAARRRKKNQTSPAVFWILCIVAGVLIGIIAYLIVSSIT
jgi:hypothetical protein